MDALPARPDGGARALDPGSVLDAGCGEGYVTGWIAEAFPAARVAGVDGRDDALDALRARSPGVEVAVGDVYSLPFADDAFEVVICTEVMEHLEEPERGLAELARVASRALVLTVPHEPGFRLGQSACGPATWPAWARRRATSRPGGAAGSRGSWPAGRSRALALAVSLAARRRARLARLGADRVSGGPLDHGGDHLVVLRGPRIACRVAAIISPTSPRVISWTPTTISRTPRISRGRPPIDVAAELEHGQVGADEHAEGDRGQARPRRRGGAAAASSGRGRRRSSGRAGRGRSARSRTSSCRARGGGG